MSGKLFDYGVQGSLLAGLEIYEQASRGSGRTRQMMAALKGGETVIAWKGRDYILSMARELELRVTVVAVTSQDALVSAIQDAHRRGSTPVLDHHVIFNVYRGAVSGAGRMLYELAKVAPHPAGEILGGPPPVNSWLQDQKR